MSITNGPNLGLMENANTGEAHDAALRSLLRGLDGLVMPNAKGYLTNTPPGSPSNGDLYIIGAAPTGAWAGQGGKVTRYSTVSSAWEFFTPKNGWMIQANTARESYRYTGSAWEIFYQEGTFTPALSGSSTAGSPTYGTRTGIFQAIGSIIHCSYYLQTTALGGMAGNVVFGGLPFTVRANSQGAGVFGYTDGVTLPGSPALVVTQGSTTAGIYGFVSGGPSSQLSTSNIAASTYLIGSVTYER